MRRNWLRPSPTQEMREDEAMVVREELESEIRDVVFCWGKAIASLFYDPKEGQVKGEGEGGVDIAGT